MVVCVVTVRDVQPEIRPEVTEKVSESFENPRGLLQGERGDDFGHEFETRSLPRWLAATRRGFAFYVADPVTSVHEFTLMI